MFCERRDGGLTVSAAWHDSLICLWATMADLTVSAAMAGLTMSCGRLTAGHTFSCGRRIAGPTEVSLFCGRLMAGCTFSCGRLTAGLTEVSPFRLNGWGVNIPFTPFI